MSFKGMLNSGGKWGLYGGLVLALFSALIYIFNINVYSVWFGLISFVITFGIVIIFSYKGAVGYRDEDGPGRVDYWSALLVLFLTSLVTFYVSALFNLLLNTVIDPEYHVELFKRFEEFMYSQDLPESMVAPMLEQTKQNLAPMKQFTSSLMSSPVIGIILSFIMAFFVRKSPKYQENQF
jgi:hypothetical protein